MKSRRKRRARREHPSGELMLAALVDMMINILVFLLTLYGTSPAPAPAGEQPDLPASTARQPIRVSTVVVVSPHGISIGQDTLVPLEEAEGVIRVPARELEAGRLPALERALVTELAATRLGSAGTADEEVEAELSVQCDRRVPWDVLAPVLRTAGHAGYGKYRFAVRATGS